MLAYLFPGQGSQKRGMGQNLFDEFPQITAEADSILGYSIKDLCVNDPNQQLNSTQYTQPALYTVNALSYLQELKETQRKPDFVAGHSLGEYSALFAAGVFDFKTGLELVKKRGELMSQAVDGGMAAILGLKLDDVKQVLQQNHLEQMMIANHNSYTQIVVSGPKNEMERTRLVFENVPAVSFIPLKVSGAFHSEHMLPAQQQFEKTLQQMIFSVPHMPVIANINAEPYHPAVTSTNLAKQLTQTVRWTAIVEYLVAQGEMEFKEVGPGIVLSGLVRAIKNGR